jgi:hypothetical protein
MINILLQPKYDIEFGNGEYRMFLRLLTYLIAVSAQQTFDIVHSHIRHKKIELCF